MQLSVITPTFNEANNIVPFINAIQSSIAIKDYEIIFVDDNSTDNTYKIVKSISKKNRKVRCIRRIGRRGLSSAVIEGCLSSSSDFLVIMDADLQHDEKKINTMLSIVKNENVDLVIASRFLNKKSSSGLSKRRNYISKIANYLATKITRVTLSDPMTGFFLIKRSIFENIAPNLTGLGFKILLDIFSTSKYKPSYKEISFNFKSRKHGVSKLDSIVIWEYLLLLWESRLGKIIPARFASFCIIGGSGVIIHVLALYFMQKLNQQFIFSQGTATFIAMTSNFYFNNILTYRDKRKTGVKAIKALFLFYLTCGVGALANIGVADYIYQNNVNNMSGMWYISGILGALIGAIWNFIMSSLVTWKDK